MMKSLIFCMAFSFFAVALLMAMPAQAATWDLNADSDATSNPQGPWSYGRSEDPNDPVPFTLHTNTFNAGPGPLGSTEPHGRQ